MRLGDEADIPLLSGVFSANHKEEKDLGAFTVCHFYAMLLGKRKMLPSTVISKIKIRKYLSTL